MYLRFPVTPTVLLTTGLCVLLPEALRAQGRWTKKDFSVALKPPPSLPDEPVTLELKFTVPEVSIQRLPSLTLSATVNGVPVGAETYDKPGDYAFSKPVPGEALDQKIVKVEFRLDKAIAAGEIETRELGLVATSVALK